MQNKHELQKFLAVARDAKTGAKTGVKTRTKMGQRRG
jgi:hypothetical protein